MAKYAQGQNEDKVIKTTEVDKTLDLTDFIRKFVKLKKALQELPVKKTEPDQETLDYWVSLEHDIPKEALDNEVLALYNKLKPIKDAGLIPPKYDDEYQQLENYINNL